MCTVHVIHHDQRVFSSYKFGDDHGSGPQLNLHPAAGRVLKTRGGQCRVPRGQRHSASVASVLTDLLATIDACTHLLVYQFRNSFVNTYRAM